jgi:hypothetical protein
MPLPEPDPRTQEVPSQQSTALVQALPAGWHCTPPSPPAVQRSTPALSGTQGELLQH